MSAQRFAYRDLQGRRKMRTERRERRYIAGHWLALLKPALRYSGSRNAYVLRLVGRKVGPVLKVERRQGHVFYPGERRSTGFRAAEQRRRAVA
jgi:hypothetical protein